MRAQRGSGVLPVGDSSFGNDRLMTKSEEATTFSHKCEWYPACEWSMGFIHGAETKKGTYDQVHGNN